MTLNLSGFSTNSIDETTLKAALENFYQLNPDNKGLTQLYGLFVAVLEGYSKGNTAQDVSPSFVVVTGRQAQRVAAYVRRINAIVDASVKQTHPQEDLYKLFVRVVDTALHVDLHPRSSLSKLRTLLSCGYRKFKL